MSYLKNTLQLIIFILFTATLVFSLFEWFGVSRSFSFLKKHAPRDERGFDEFDPSLSYINSMSKLESYVDMSYKQGNYNPNDPAAYPELAESIIRKRFYHGMSEFGAGNNYVAGAIAWCTRSDLKAIVLPDDILKYPYAMCSQQSLVLMKLLKKKGYDYRMVGFNPKELKGGHYAFEIKYNNKWHFFDPDMEPDARLLNRNNRPSIAELVANKALLFASYHYWDKNHIAKMFPSYFYGSPNGSIAPRATIFQRITYILSYSLWLFFLFAYVLVNKLLPSKKRRYIPQPQLSWYFNTAKFKA
ncbi:MAG TPA: hypothetical protein VGQ09_20985 [Chitinophagaceae bacterium]|jgi:hypothetical protein|nr:hypothetical protein [Chitinophagaceae bacterium]